MRGPPRASAARWSRTSRSDRRRVFAPRQPERLVRGAASIGTRGYLAGPPHPIPDERAQAATVDAGIPRWAATGCAAPSGSISAHPPALHFSFCGGFAPTPPRRDGSAAGTQPRGRSGSSSRREGREPDCPRWPRRGRGTPHPRPLPQGERGPEPARREPEARCAPFRRRFAKVSSERGGRRGQMGGRAVEALAAGELRLAALGEGADALAGVLGQE